MNSSGKRMNDDDYPGPWDPSKPYHHFFVHANEESEVYAVCTKEPNPFDPSGAIETKELLIAKTMNTAQWISDVLNTLGACEVSHRAIGNMVYKMSPDEYKLLKAEDLPESNRFVAQKGRGFFQKEDLT